MFKILKKAAILALLLQTTAGATAAADVPGFEYRVYSKGLQSLVDAPAPETPAPETPARTSVLVEVRQLQSGGCSVNGTNFVGKPSGGCESHLGKWVMNQSYVKGPYTDVILTAPASPSQQSIRSSSFGEGYSGPGCIIKFNGSSGSTSIAYKFVSDDDWRLCVDDKLAGYYHLSLGATSISSNPVQNLLQPIDNLLIQVTEVATANGCAVRIAENSAVIFTPNYLENGVNLCEVGKSLYMHPGNVLRTTP